MTRKIELKCIVQRDDTDKNKYYPKINSAHITSVFPFTCPTATIEVNTNVSHDTSLYMPPVRVDDIVRVQANVQYSTDETPVYQDVFEGRIMKIESRFGRDNVTILHCRGHAEELLYRIITADYSAAATTTGAMLSALMGLYLTRLADDTPSQIDSTDSTSIGNYNVQQDTKYMIDVVREFESLELYNYIFSVDPEYDEDDNLSDVFVSWAEVPATASTTVQIIEGTQRLISASFSDSLERCVEDVTIYGASGTPQKVGMSIDGSPSYGTRYHVGTDMSIATDALCTDVADAIRDRFGSSIVRGNAEILGDPNIHVGDLIYCKIPSIELNGNTIDGNYRCCRVTHQIGAGGWQTYVDLGEPDVTIFDMISGYLVQIRHENANFVE